MPGPNEDNPSGAGLRGDGWFESTLPGEVTYEGLWWVWGFPVDYSGDSR